MRTAHPANDEMVDRLIARGALHSAALIDSFRSTPRHLFLDRIWQNRGGSWREIDSTSPQDEDLLTLYSDRALATKVIPSSSGEAPVSVSSSSQPSLMAQMLEDLRLAPNLRVLEIGAGTGYNSALLAHIVGRVVSLDIDREVLADAQRHLRAFPDRFVELLHADGRQGWRDAAPYDRIQVTAASLDLEPAWLEQMAEGGLIQVPIDFAPELAWVAQGEVRGGVFTGRLTRPAYFMPLRDEDVPGRDRGLSTGPLPGPDRLQSVPAPWANWQERRPGGFEPIDFLPGVGMLAWLEGFTVGYSTCPDGRPGYGIGDLVRGEACWLGPYEWRISGKGGQELGQRVWKRWLDLGGPRPDDWTLLAAGPETPLPEPTATRVSFTRQGPRCAQRWQVEEYRRRAD